MAVGSESGFSGDSGSIGTQWWAAITIKDVFIPSASYDGNPYCQNPGACCFNGPAFPAVGSGSGSGEGSLPGSGSGSSVSGGTVPMFVECAGQCIHTFNTMTQGGTGSGSDSSGLSGDCPISTGSPPPRWWLERWCRFLGQPFFFDQELAQAACYYLTHPYPTNCTSPASINEIRWCDTILPSWQQYQQSHQATIMANCLGITPPEEDFPEAWLKIKTVQLPAGSYVVRTRCVLVPASDVCQVCNGLSFVSGA